MIAISANGPSAIYSQASLLFQMKLVHKMLQGILVFLGGFIERRQKVVDMREHESLKSRWSMQVVETLFQP